MRISWYLIEKISVFGKPFIVTLIDPLVHKFPLLNKTFYSGPIDKFVLGAGSIGVATLNVVKIAINTYNLR